MKKIFIIIPCLILILLTSTLVISANEYPADIYINSKPFVNPGEEASIIIDANIKSGYDIQGIQIDFKFSDNFPEIKKCELMVNTTAWTNTDITKNNLLGVGNVINTDSQLVARILFDIPYDAASGTEYIFTPENIIVANAYEELDAKLNKDSVSITVGGKSPDVNTEDNNDVKDEDSQSTVVKPDYSGGNNSSTLPVDKNSETNSNGKDTKPDSEIITEPKEWKNPFSDINKDDWFYESVQFVYENEYMSGVAQKKFAPNETLTRAMLVTILHRIDGCSESGTFAFNDVERKSWYTKAIDWAAWNGIVNGVGNGCFAPNESVTREQIAVIFYNYAKFKEMNLSVEKDLSAFADSNEISSWADTALKWATASELINGKENNLLDPQGRATRAEAATIIKRYIEKLY